MRLLYEKKRAFSTIALILGSPNSDTCLLGLGSDDMHNVIFIEEFLKLTHKNVDFDSFERMADVPAGTGQGLKSR
jgi:hypothetical protein